MKLGDGSPLPEKRQFENVNYNAQTRTFTAQVSWKPPATYMGCTLRKFTMVFSEDLSMIESGTVMSEDKDEGGNPKVYMEY